MPTPLHFKFECYGLPRHVPGASVPIPPSPYQWCTEKSYGVTWMAPENMFTAVKVLLCMQ